MSGVLSAVIIIFILGVLIVVHELGHFLAARNRGVRVLEFAIGMGPVLYKRQKKLPTGEDGVKFTLRALPIGGFCSMEGEDASSEDPNAFPNASKISRLIILLAGSAMNLLLGLLLAFLLVAPTQNIVTPVISDISPVSTLAEGGLMAGDKIMKINGHGIYRFNDVTLFLELGKNRPYDIEVKRGGETLKFRDMTIEKRDFGGQMRYGFSGTLVTNPTFTDKLYLGFFTAVDYCRLVWVSLGEIISGRAGADALTGPVGMGGIVNDVVTVPDVTLFSRIWALLDMMILITLNLGIFNLLPLPALDGGRIIFIIIEAVRRKPVPAKYEGVVHGVGMIAFFALMIFVFYNDIVRLVTGGA